MLRTGYWKRGQRIYVASSWRNVYQSDVVARLRSLGCEVYDFKNPAPGNHGFGWREIDPNWQQWSPAQYRGAMAHPIAKAGYDADFNAMRWCDTCVLVMPAGRSASFELGWCMGAGKRAIVLIPEPIEPELMFRGAELVISFDELAEAIGQ
jgi:hypothetical protein